MALVTPSVVFSPTTPITSAALNLAAQPTVSLGTNEVTLANLPSAASNNLLLGRASTGAGNYEAIDTTTTGLGFYTGAGGAVTQITSRTTGVTLAKMTGAITLVSAAGSATPATFTVTNSKVAATDVPHVVQKSGTDLYEIFVTAVTDGSFNITFFTTGGTTTEQPVFSFVLLKGVTA